MKLLGYYTTANDATFKSANPRAAYINLSLVDKWVKTTVMIGGKFVSIPRWLVRDHLSIEQLLDPMRKSTRHSKDRLTVHPKLTEMLAERGYRFGRHMNTFIPEPRLTMKDVVKMGYADATRQELREGDITHVEVVRRVMVSFFDVRSDYSNNNDAVAACRELNGWNWFEFQAAWEMYHRASNKWVAPNDPAGESP